MLILLLCFVEADYQTYLRETSEATAIVEVKEGLSINYIDGKSFEVNSPSKSITFSVTNLKMYDIPLRIICTNSKRKDENGEPIKDIIYIRLGGIV